MKVYMTTELVTSNTDTEMYTPASWLETVVGSVVGGVSSGVAGAIVTDSLPGPAVPG